MIDPIIPRSTDYALLVAIMLRTNSFAELVEITGLSRRRISDMANGKQSGKYSQSKIREAAIEMLSDYDLRRCGIGNEL